MAAGTKQKWVNRKGSRLASAQVGTVCNSPSIRLNICRSKSHKKRGFGRNQKPFA